MKALDCLETSTGSSAVESKEHSLSCAALCFGVLPCAVLLQCNQSKGSQQPQLATSWVGGSSHASALPLSSLTMCSAPSGSLLLGSGWFGR